MAATPFRTRWLIAGGALLAVVAAAITWRLMRADPVQTHPVAYGEVQMRVTGPGTVQARVLASVGARISAQIVALHADHGDRVKRGTDRLGRGRDLRGVPLTVAIDGQDVVEHGAHVGTSRSPR